MHIKRLLSILAVLLIAISLSLCFSACGDEEQGGEPVVKDHDHTLSDWETVQKPTCAKEGKKVRRCSTCDYEEFSAIATLEHVYSEDGKIVRPATCSKSGTKKYPCTGAGCTKNLIKEYYIEELSETEIYNKTLKSVGEIVTYDNKGNELSIGMGIIYSAGGKLITNYHVMDGAYTATFEISGTVYGIDSVLAYDEKLDLIMLQIMANDSFHEANFCSEPLSAEDKVYAIGFPRGTSNSCFSGTIIDASKDMNGVAYVHHDATIGNTCSGGPLVNAYGEIVGINSYKLSDSQNMKLSVFAGEIEKLEQDVDMSVSEFYEAHNNPYDLLLEWLVVNYNNDRNDHYRYEYYENYILYTIGYDNTSRKLYLELFKEHESGADVYFTLELGSDPTRFSYNASHALEGDTNATRGYLNAKTFTADTILTFEANDGGTWGETELMECYSSALADLLEWFDWAAFSNGIGITSYDFGFEAFEVA